MWFFMPNLTLSITEKTKQRMGKHREVRWSNVVRVVIERKLSDFEEAERLAQKSLLSERDIEMLASKANKAMAKHAVGLLNEGNG